MIVWTAIDILEGRAVRLEQGREETAKDYGDAFEALERWTSKGLRHFHVVDLSAAFGRRPCLVSFLNERMGRWPGARLQVAGGIRSAEVARRLVDLGADRLVLGTLVLTDPEETSRVLAAVGPKRCVASVDVLDGRVRIAGWTRETAWTLPEALRHVASLGFEEVLVTDIARDGTMQGPNLELYRADFGLRFLASGGVRSREDLDALARIPHVSGAIVGRSLYENQLTPEEL